MKYTIKIIFITLFVFLGLFLLDTPNTYACNVNVAQSSVRVSGGLDTNQVLDPEFFQDENPPFVYLDLKPQGCGESDNLYVNVFSMQDGPEMSDSGSIFDYALNSSQLQQDGGVTIAFKAGEQPCDGWAEANDNNAECQIFFVVSTLPLSNPDTEIVLLVGDMMEGITPENAQSFSGVYGGGLGPLSSCTDLGAGGYFYYSATTTPASVGLLDIFEDYLIGLISISPGGIINGFLASETIDFTPGTDPCNANLYAPFSTEIFRFDSTVGGIGTQKLKSYYTSLGNDFLELAYGQLPQDVNFFDEWFSSFTHPPVAALAFSELRYKCDVVCDTDWGIAPNPYLEFGAVHPLDEGVSNLSTISDFYDDEYFPLAPLPFEGLNGGVTPTLGDYLAGLFKALIIVTVILSVVMIVIGGIAYMTVDAARNKSEHKEKIWNAIIGLLIALGSWLLLNTINPELASNLSIQIPTVSLDGYEYISPGVANLPSGCGPQGEVMCTDCQEIGGGIILKPEVAQAGHNTIKSSMLTKLNSMQETLTANNIQWRVTEAFNPTYLGHCSQCHYNGTCIDANFTGQTSASPEVIENFVNAANSAGLRAVYETNSSQTIQQIQEQTDLEPSVKNGGGNYLLLNGITAPHFSVYNN